MRKPGFVTRKGGRGPPFSPSALCLPRQADRAAAQPQDDLAGLHQARPNHDPDMLIRQLAAAEFVQDQIHVLDQIQVLQQELVFADAGGPSDPTQG